MPNYLSPQVAVNEVESGIRSIRGVSTAIAAMIGLAEKGKIGVAKPVFGLQDFVNKHGGPIPGALLYWAVRAFYACAGTGAPLYIVRTAHYTDITDKTTLTASAASRTYKDQLGSVDTLTIRASSEGTWGNTLQITTALASRFATTMNHGSALATGATSVVLTNVDGIHRGTVLKLDDTVDNVTVVVDRVENKRVYFQSAITLGGGATIADGAAVTQLSFNIIIYQGDIEIDRVEYVSMEDTDAVDYVETRINGINRWIEVEDEDTSNTAGVDRPAAGTALFLSGGTDGLSSLASGDYIGNPASETGLYALDKIDVVNMVGVPESQASAVQLAIIDYCESRQFIYGVLNSPVALDESEVIEYVEDTLAANTSRSGFYYKQIKMYDPSTDGTKLVPADGHVMGTYAAIDGRIGVQQVAAGETGVLRDIMDFENDYAQKKGARDLLYPKNINSLITHPNLGRCIFGSRTLSKAGGIGTQINERRVFNYIGQSLYNGLHFVLFKNNTAPFRKSVASTITQFLVLQQQAGVLEAFAVDVGDDLNNALVRASGKLVAAVAIKVPDTIEFMEVNLTRDTRAQEAALAELAA